MNYKTNWKDFLKYDEHGRRVRDWPSIVVETGPNEKNYMYKGEYDAMIAAEKAAKNAQRAARQAELAATRPNSVNSEVTGEIASPGSKSPARINRRGFPTSLHPAPVPPDFERHSRKCAICSHPDRDVIEGEFIRWRSPHKIVRDYGLSDRSTVYRHAHATDLFAERRRHVARVLESYLETIDDNPPEDFDPVTRAVRVYAHLNTHGDWFEPMRKVHITTSHAPYPNPHPEAHVDSEPESNLELDIDNDLASALTVEARPRTESFPSASTQVPSGTAEGSPARQPGENQRHEPPTSDPEFRDRPSRASQEKSQHEESRAVTGESSTNVAVSGRDDSFSRNPHALSEVEGSFATSHCLQSNRHNAGAKFDSSNSKPTT